LPSREEARNKKKVGKTNFEIFPSLASKYEFVNVFCQAFDMADLTLQS
jgi:hypothetical protein